MSNLGSARQAGCLIFLIAWISTCASDKYRSMMGPRLAGPFRAEVVSVGLCPENRGDDRLNMTLKIVNDKHVPNRLYMDGDIQMGEPYDDQDSVIVRLMPGDGKGNFRSTGMMIFRFKEVCKASLVHATKIVKRMAVTRFGEERICPFEPGSWTIHNMSIDHGMDKVKSLPYGHWKGETELVRNGRTWTCVRFIIHLLPL